MWQALEIQLELVYEQVKIFAGIGNCAQPGDELVYEQDKILFLKSFFKILFQFFKCFFTEFSFFKSYYLKSLNII